MPDNKDKANQDSATAFLELFMQSYEAPKSDDVIENSYNSTDDLSPEELQRKLRMQFAADGDVAGDSEDDPYHIDADFLADAEELTVESEYTEEINEIKENKGVEENEIEIEEKDYEDIEEVEKIEDLEEIEEIEVDKGIEEDEAFEEIEEIEVGEDLEEEFEEELEDLEEIEVDQEDQKVLEEFIIEDVTDEDDITFDELVELEESDGIQFTKIDLDDDVELLVDDDITFEDLELIETAGDTLVLTKIDIDEQPPEESFRSLFVNDKYVVEPVENIEQTEPVAEADEKAVSEADDDDDYLSEIFAEEVQTKQADVLDAYDISDTDEASQVTLDSSEMSLLMQFGCDADKLSKFAVKSDDEPQKDASETKVSKRKKILEVHEKYAHRRVNALLRLIISGFFAFGLLFYDGLPIIGVELPGIMNREYYFVSYLLLGFQLVALCLLPSYKQIWTGAKKLFSIRPDVYSIVVALAGTVLIYDFTLLFVNDGSIPPVFHFALACVMVFVQLLEFQIISTEKRCFEMFFFDEISENEERTQKFTLYKSKGKNSTAEKLYAGGVAREKAVYTPFEIQSTEAVISALQKQSRRRDFSMVAFIPSLAFSLVLWLVSLIITGHLWISLCSLIVSMLITLPIVGALFMWLPFDRFSAKSKRAGYSFASQASMEEYSDSNIFVFKDTHLFSRVEASSVNMVLYDSTTKDVLLGCLDAVYSKIGGPMENTFSRGDKKRFDNCRIARVAKNGVEAVVEKNYSVLIGTELFMARYGISFPNASLNNKEDQVFTLCVSINGRTTARLAVRYSVNDMFNMFSTRLMEDGIYCAVETFDPMISTELISRLMPDKKAPISIVHLNAQNLVEKDINSRDKFMFDVEDRELGVIALTSRLNLAVALCDAKRMKKMATRVNLLSIGLCILGAILAFLAVWFKISEYINELYVILYWMAGIGGFCGLVFGTLPKSTRFSFEAFKAERMQAETQKIQDGKNQK